MKDPLLQKAAGLTAKLRKDEERRLERKKRLLRRAEELSARLQEHEEHKNLTEDL